MADVYAARDTHLGRDVAIKFFRPLEDAAMRSRFVSEAQVMANLSHPALVTVYDAWLADDRRPYLIISLMDGGTLRRRIKEGPLPADQVARFGIRLTSALAHVHAHEIVHRDIKPANVLIDHAGACYLGDFGLAWTRNSAHITNSGEMVGTAGYLAPEQVAGDTVGPAADVYALGLVLLESLTGRTEYEGTEVEAAVARLARQPVVPMELGRSWHDVLTAMTARDPAARPTAADCAQRLHAMTQPPGTSTDSHGDSYGDTGPRSRDSDSGESGVQPPDRRNSARVGLGAAGVASVVLTAVLLTTSGSTTVPGDAVPGSPQDPAPTPTPTQPDHRQQPGPARETPPAPNTPRAPSTRPAGDAPPATEEPEGDKRKPGARQPPARQPGNNRHTLPRR